MIGRTPVNVKPARKRKEHKSTGYTTAQNGTKSNGRFQKFFRTLEQKARTSKEEWKWQRGIVDHLLSGSQWNGSSQHEKIGVGKAQELGHASRRLQGPGSLLENAGKWRASGWAVVQLDYDEEVGPLHGMYGSMEGELEVQRTIKRAELTAFLCHLRKVSGPIKVRVGNKGIIDGLRKGEKECVKPRAGDADLWLKKIWEELHELVKRDIFVEVSLVKAHRTKKQTENMTKNVRSVTEGH